MLILAGCAAVMRDTPAPIPTREYRASPGQRAATLIVGLPGRGGSMGDFERHGLVRALQEAGVRADVVAVDAHLGYYYRRTVIERLRADVLEPARQAGYRRLVLVGVSLGGLGALLCERDRPGSVDALVLMAPYLGDSAKLFEGIVAAGGPEKWAAGRDPQAGEVDVQLWTFLGNKSAQLPPTWLLAGRRDSLATGHRLLAGMLPAERVAMIEGAHDWGTWSALWREVCAGAELFRAERTAR
jgi:pimeloyl-ACP methyl ester carboxylesterase